MNINTELTKAMQIQYKILIITIMSCLSVKMAGQYTLDNPIEIGTKITDFSYSHNFPTHWPPEMAGHYRFTITKSMDVTISHCGTTTTLTEVTLLNSSEQEIAYNGNEEKCNSTPKLTYKSLPAGTYYVVSKAKSHRGTIVTTINGVVAKTEYNIGSISNNCSFTYNENTKNGSNFYIGRPTNDVHYKFSLYKTMDLMVSHCGSEVKDTFIYLLDASGNIIDYSNAKSCINDLKVEGLSAGTYTVISEGNNENGNISTKIQLKIPKTLHKVGSKTSDFSYSHTQNTSNTSNYYEGKSTNDVYYEFTIAKPMDIITSHCGSNVRETNIYLLDSAGNKIASSDNNAGMDACPSIKQAYLKYPELLAGTYFIISEGDTENGYITTAIQGKISREELYRNSIHTYIYTSENEDNPSYLEKIQYFDGIGRPNQTMQRGISPTHKDLVFLQEYDEFGRESKSWLPAVIANNNGTYIAPSTVKTATISSNNDQIPYSQTIYEASPLNRISKQFGAGDKWKKNEKSIDIERLIYFNPHYDRYLERTDNDFGIQNMDFDIPCDLIAKSGRSVTTINLLTVKEFDFYINTYNIKSPLRLISISIKDINTGEIMNFESLKSYKPGNYQVMLYIENSTSSDIEYFIRFSGSSEDEWEAAPIPPHIRIKYNSYKGTTPNTISLQKTGEYKIGQLFITKTTDEDGNILYECRDNMDRLILTRQRIGHEPFETNYVYDEKGNLCFVLPPLATDDLSDDGQIWGESNPALANYAYIYRYDKFNRCIWKKLPGAEPIQYVYDKSDRLIFSQDGEQRKKGEWTFAIPDIFGRNVLTGTISNAAIKIGMWDNTNTIVTAQYIGDAANRANMGYKINGSTFTITPKVIYSANYYDNYNFIGKNIANNVNFPNYTFDSSHGTEFNKKYDNAKGIVTGSVIAQFNSNGTISHLYSAMYYDNRGRLIQTRSTNHLGGIETECVAYNFINQPLKTKHVHTASGKTTQTEVYEYAYDHAGRLLTTKHQLNGGTNTLIDTNTYDELGRLKENKKGSHTSLNTAYTYNVRSWTTSMKSSHLHVNLDYTYSGNVKTQSWMQEGKTRKYDFIYDNLSRVKEAKFTGIGTENFATSYTYDKHGNITQLVRNGLRSTGIYGQMDNLAISYVGNQLNNVHNMGGKSTIAGSAHFQDYSIDAAKTKKEYTYNANGAMTQDLNKGITTIQYNSLNLPQQMDILSPVAEARNEYIYSASGQKLRVKTSWNPAFKQTPIIGTAINPSSLTKSTTTDYVGNMIYEGGATPKRILIDGGYIEGGTYHYYLTDHLGNNRVVANAGGTPIQRTHYYPFGMAFAEGTGPEKQPYKYNGKELDSRHGLNTYDYSARYFDPTVPRFSSIDPLAEKYYSWSPYAYVMNNPLKYIDPTGMFIDDYFNRDGNYLGYDNSETDYVRVMKQEDWDNNKTSNITIDASVGQQNSALHSKSNITSEASLNIYQHYNPTDLPLTDVSSKYIGRNDTGMEFRYRRSTKQAVDIGIDITGFKRTKISDNIPEITNIFTHENKHYSDFKAWGFDIYVATPLQIREQRAIFEEMRSPSFNQMRPGLQRASRSYGKQNGIFYNEPQYMSVPVLIPVKTIISKPKP